MSSLAPIILFVYNRPLHTRKCLDALQKNELANESELFIYADGPKENPSYDQLQKIKEVRKLIIEKKWCKEVHIIESEKNKGLVNSVIDGVTEIVNKFGKIIVLEDDLVTSPFFLKFMNEGLEFYKDISEVISVHAYVYPVKRKLPDTFFLRGADCWGWATWKRGWELFEEDGKKLLKNIFLRNLEKDFDFNNSYPFIQMLIDQNDGKNNSWAIKWYASAFLNNKFTLYPGISFVQNIGNDNSGTHIGNSNKFTIKKLNNESKIKFINIVEENRIARKAIGDFFYCIEHPNIMDRVAYKLSSLVRSKKKL